MKVPKSCQKLCRQEYNEKQMKFFRHLIDEEYRVHWSVFSASLRLCLCMYACPTDIDIGIFFRTLVQQDPGLAARGGAQRPLQLHLARLPRGLRHARQLQAGMGSSLMLLVRR